jgi:hypothetical protein
MSWSAARSNCELPRAVKWRYAVVVKGGGFPMDDKDILRHISELVAEEKDLRSRAGGGSRLSEDDRERIKHLETQLDQCWDLLRQRQAREEFGDDPDLVHERPADVVEHYRQ